MEEVRDPTAIQAVDQHIVEIVSDSGEGAQKAGQAFGAVSAKMRNGVWTVEIIPAEIKPPARSPAGASGIRIRIGDRPMTNTGDEADLVIAFNEQVLFGRIDQRAYRPGTILLLENKWATDRLESIRESYAAAVERFKGIGLNILELPISAACAEMTGGARVGKNMFVLGMLCHIYDRDLDIATNEVGLLFGHKGAKVVDSNQRLVRAGWKFAREKVPYHFHVAPHDGTAPQIVMNGNQAMGLGVMASGMDVVSMYPITPATSASHYLAGCFYEAGGFVHQAEDEIAAIGFAIGASYAGKTACTITSGPGLALKTELIGLAVMAEVPLVIGLVQRGGPSTGLPTKVEQGDLLASLFGAPGDAPKIVLAAATIADCFHMMVLARRLAEDFRAVVIVLSDTNLATGVSSFDRPQPKAEWIAPPIDQSDWDPKVPPYDWDPKTGLSPRPVPGQAGGQYILTGLAHTRQSKVAYDADTNQESCELRSLKLATLQSTLKPPPVHGAESGDLLVVGWGSTHGAIQEAVDRARAQGLSVSAVHLRFLSPLEPGLEEIFGRFKRVMTVEINYADPIGGFVNDENRRYAQLAFMLRAATLLDIECWGSVPGQPLSPAKILNAITTRLEA
jgi:2-oxoglutarate/2-oxoacid ferredoxin oxidoreductase subunit alpha